MNHSRVEEVLRAYAAIWAEPDAVRRDEFLAQSLLSDAEVIGPGYQFKGHRAISAEVERFLHHDPGSRPVFSSGYVAHHNVARFTVAMLDRQDVVVAEGEDIVEFAEDGRIARVITFWGALPPVPESWPPELCAPRHNGV